MMAKGVGGVGPVPHGWPAGGPARGCDGCVVDVRREAVARRSQHMDRRQSRCTTVAVGVHGMDAAVGACTRPPPRVYWRPRFVIHIVLPSPSLHYPIPTRQRTPTPIPTPCSSIH